MSWLDDLAPLVVPGISPTTAVRDHADEHHAGDEVERLLERIEHPAGRALAPVPPTRSSSS